MPYQDGGTIGDELPIGAIIMEDRKIFKVIQSQNKDGQKLLKQIADFEVDILAKGSGKYLINLNQRVGLTDLSFTSNLNAFKSYIRPYYFKGSADDLESLVSMMCKNVIAEEHDSLIIIKDYVGWYEHPEMGFWVFGDRIIITHKKGKKLPIPHQVIFGNQNVLKVDDLWISIDLTGLNRSLIPQYKDPDGYTLQDFLPQWLAQLNNKTLLYSFLGWGISTLFYDHINRLRKCDPFPFFVVTAGTEVGKTALLSNCIQIFGVKYIGENYSSSVTKAVEMIEFMRVSHLPIWRDEYKNEKYALDKESFLRSVYTRSFSSRADKELNTKSFPTRATLLLSGEDITEDPALSRRMIKMRMAKEDKVDKATHEQNSKNAQEHFAKVLPLLLAAPFDDKIFLDIFYNEKILNDTEMRDELMCYAALGAVFGRQVAEEAIQCANVYHKKTESHIINNRQVTAEEFFQNLDSLFLEKGWYDSLYSAKPKVLDYFHCLASKDTVFFKFTALHALLSKNRNREEYRWSKKALGQLIMESYNAKMEPRRYNNESNWVMIVDGIDSLQDIAGDLFHRIQTVQKKWEDGLIPDNLPSQI